MIFLVRFALIIFFVGNIGTETNIQEPESNGNASELDINASELDMDDVYDKIFDTLNIKELDRIYDINPTGVNLDIGELLSGIVNGDGKYVIGTALKAIRIGILGEVMENRRLMLELITIVLIGSLFVNISNSFGQSFISENGFYVTYLIMTAIMLSAFVVTLDMVSENLKIILNLIRGIVPIYALSMNYVGHTTQAAGMYQVVMVLVWLVEAVIIKFILPMIKFYIIISMVNNLNKEDNFSKLCQLINHIVTWLLKTIVIFIVGLNLIKSLIEPQIDVTSRNFITKVTNAIPGGGVMSVLTGTFLGAGVVVKNCIGVVGILMIAFAVLIPVIKLLIIMFVVKLTGAIIQPVGDKRYVTGFDALGKSMYLLLQALLSSVVMFMLTVAIVAFSGKS